MELYDFMRSTLAWTATIACLWPLNAPMLAFAFKVQQGAKPIDMENDEYWTRSTVGSLVIALVTAAAIFVDYMLAHPDWVGLPAGPVHLTIYVAYVPLVVWLLALFFAIDDLAQGLSIFMIYLYLPIFVLFVLNWLLGLVNPSLRFWDLLLNLVYPWLVSVRSGT
jgi:hypothetical protein